MHGFPFCTNCLGFADEGGAIVIPRVQETRAFAAVIEPPRPKRKIVVNV